jgi:hypothetical protein
MVYNNNTMTHTTKNVLIGLVGLIVLIVIGALFINSFAPDRVDPQDEQEIRALVMNFGEGLKNVPLSAPSEATAQAISNEYSRFVTEDLLETWLQDPPQAPGRLTSSPWPDRIEIISVAKSGTTYIVRGNIILMTSTEVSQGGNAGTEPVLISVRKEDGMWRISDFRRDENPEGEGLSLTYSHTDPMFSFSYPQYAQLNTGAPSNKTDEFWSELETGRTEGDTYVSLHIPRSFMPGTNFSEAWLSVGSSAETTAVSRCMTPPQAGTSTQRETLGGQTYARLSQEDAGAGNFYETTSYRALENGSCWALEYTIHSTNIGNYEPGTVTEFDKTHIENILKDIIRSFRF